MNYHVVARGNLLYLFIPITPVNYVRLYLHSEKRSRLIVYPGSRDVLGSTAKYHFRYYEEVYKRLTEQYSGGSTFKKSCCAKPAGLVN